MATTITISGKVLYQNGIAAQEGFRVVAKERQLRLNPTLSEVSITARGSYSLVLRDIAESTSYYLEVPNEQGKVLLKEGPFSVRAGNIKLDLILNDEFYTGKPVFKTREAGLKKYVAEWRQGGTNQPITADDARFVASQTGEDPSEAWRWMKAHQLEVETTNGANKMPAEALYGLLKQGLPGSIQALSALPNGDIVQALQQAMKTNQISDAVPVGVLMKSWNELLGSKSLSEKPEGMDASLGEILTIAGANTGDKNKMMALLSEHTGSDEAYWEKLATAIGNNNNSNNKVTRLRKAMQLTAFVGFQPRMVGALLQETPIENIHAVAALAGKDNEDWKAFIQAASTGGSAVPTFIKGRNETERIAQYAAILAKTSETAFPTHAFFGRLSKIAATDGFGASKADLQMFFTQNPNFEFKKAAIEALAEGTGLNLTGISSPQSLLKELRSARRMMGFTPNTKAMQALRKAGLDSASAVAAIPSRQFISRLGGAFDTEEEALQAHHQAESKASLVTAIWAAGHPNLNLATTATIGSYIANSSNATLRSLFGSLDACECEHCMSLFSLAAYLTDLLHFLSSRSEEAYDELVRRRPDLPGLLLNCENTNTPLPYIDLVIELLEDFVSPLPDSTARQTTLSAAELAANPEYSNDAAYDVLKTAIYPTRLSFNFPLEESRVYLSHLQQSRHQLMTCFFPGKELAAFADPHVAIEFIGMSVQERDIVTAQTTGDGTSDNGVWNFYGINKAFGFRPILDPDGGSPLDTPENWISFLSDRVDVFLQQAGVSYIELITLLGCEFINPGSTKGNPKITIASKDTDRPDTCDLKQLKLEGLDEDDLVRWHRFLRLSRRLHWTYYELDQALKSMGIRGLNPDGTPQPEARFLTADQVRKLSQIEQLRRRFNCLVEEVLAMWNNLPSVGYTDFSKTPSSAVPALYEKIFRNKAVLNPLNDALKADPVALSGIMDSHSASIQAALRISEEDYRLLRSSSRVAANSDLNLQNLSSFYRHATMAQWTGLSISELLQQIDLFGINPFENPVETYAFLWKTDFIQDSGFSLAELDYLLRDMVVKPSGIAPSDVALQLFLNEVGAMPERNENMLAGKFSGAFGLSAAAADLLLIKHLKSSSNPAVAMVQDFINPDTVETTKTADYRKFAKAAMLVKRLKISNEELKQIFENQTLIGCLDFDALPITIQVNAHWEGFEGLVNLIRARDLLGFGTSHLFDILQNALVTEASKEGWLEKLAQVTGWDKVSITSLVGSADIVDSGGILKVDFPTDFRNGDLILRIKKALNALHTTGISGDLMKKVVLPDINSQTATAIKQAVKSKYDDVQWRNIAKPLRDVLREQQRAALVDYAVHHTGPWKSSEELYAYLLIDVEMKPVSMTSRLKQATCSVQLFVDRVLMNLERSEETGLHVHLQPEQTEEWKTWRKIYRVWEANRKIFLYPENWIEPELRDDQTPFFKDATDALLQNELTPNTVEDAFRGYLEKLDEVARLEIVGSTHQQEPEEGDQSAIDILHVFGRTYTQPHQYFHRSLEKGEWTSWLKMEGDIDSDHLVPVIFNRRLCLFWLFFTQEAEESSPINPAVILPKTSYYWKIQIAWSEFRNNAWTGKKLSKSFVHTESTSNKTRLSELRKGLFVRPYMAKDRLLVNLKPVKIREDVEAHLFVMGTGLSYCQTSFMFENTSSEPSVIPDQLPTGFSLPLPANTVFENELISGSSADLKLRYETVSPDGRISLGEYQKVFNNTANSPFRLSVEAGAPQPLARLFFFQDQKSSFIIKTTYFKKHLRENLYSDLPDVYTVEKSIGHIWGQVFNQRGNSMRRRSEVDYPSGGNSPILESSFDGLDAALIITRCTAENQMVETLPHDLATGFDVPYVPSADPSRRIGRYFEVSAYYHPHVKNFIRTLNKSGVPAVLRRSVQEGSDLVDFQEYEPTAAVRDHPKGIVDFTYGSPYSQYNWEVFFHLPIHIACRLSTDQRFEEARKWFHYIFDPTTGDTGDKERFWQFNPFFEEAKKGFTTEEDFLRNEADLAAQIEKWAANPFQPHIVARMRVTAYMKFTVMKYIDNLIAWGDQLFRRDTIESINEATNLYILASNILGNPPQKVPSLVKRQDETFDGLKDNPGISFYPLADLETYISDMPEGTNAVGTTSALGAMFYFGVPRNEYLLKYWETVADRLFKIRHSLNIEGIARSLPLFEPPIDPALLVRAAAAGLDLNSLLNDVNGRLPHYRFAFTLQKAYELVNEVKGLGASLLSALEKRDAEALSLLRSGHEQHLLSALLQIREKQVEEAKEQVRGLEKSKKIIEVRVDYYQNLKDYNVWEKLSIASSTTASGLWPMVAGIEGIAALLNSYEAKLGSPTTVGVTTKAGEISKGVARVIETTINLANTASGLTAFMGQRERKKEERLYQKDLATKELEQINHQILAAEIRLAIAERERSNHKLQMEQSAETDEFMRSKFTNRQLYDWMAGQVSTLYFQTYQMAYDLAKQAERCFNLELPNDALEAGYVKFGYWDNLKKGLLSGEKLQFDLRRLENAYLEENKREYEIVKHVSLFLLDPLAIIQLRSTGACAFEIPEALYDMDFAGQYFRRLKSVSISLPCIAGPYTSVSANLRLTKSQCRTKNDLAEGSLKEFGNGQSIATSNAQNDSGIFELNFRDERYLPFEGAGAISTWELELPREIRQFDYDTISDVIIHVKYTSREGGKDLKADANGVLKEQLKKIKQSLGESGLATALNLKHDLPNEWNLLKKKGSIALTLDTSRLPYMVRPIYPEVLETAKIESVMFVAKLKGGSPDEFTIDIDRNIDRVTTNLKRAEELKLWTGLETGFVLDTPFSLSLSDEVRGKLDELILVVKYKF
ncbi:neuraminidase-like domain-containing protein [Algoriphagus sp. A40]|uniref:Tc toxin subunit A-related protein n=1 Tax=Algoriphagus sp. A40 TaxID=1945863 RepID=UPI0009875E80|nr:neuraminidase-like domain-containing protein [Algoriphagus sp. A40]OOG77102.1 hypothetical protein B0E43_05750 [Algoriphagus sp. A40]